MSLLSIIQNASRTLKLSVPDRVITATDENVTSLYGHVIAEGQSLALRNDLQEMFIETTFVSLAAEEQGDIRTLAPGFESMAVETLWNRTQRRMLEGPLSPRVWQEILGRGITSNFNGVFRIRNNKLIINPNPTAGETYAFEYKTNRWIEDATLMTRKEAFTVDTDVPVFPSSIMELGAQWRWLEATGLDYAEKKREYEMMLRNFALKNKAGRITLGSDMPRRGDYAATESP